MRGWCHGDEGRLLVVCYYLTASVEGGETSLRAISDQTGLTGPGVLNILRDFRKAIKAAQKHEAALGVPMGAWASSVLAPCDSENDGG